jgi:hypothetical protein
MIVSGRSTESELTAVCLLVAQPCLRLGDILVEKGPACECVGKEAMAIKRPVESEEGYVGLSARWTAKLSASPEDRAPGYAEMNVGSAPNEIEFCDVRADLKTRII